MANKQTRCPGLPCFNILEGPFPYLEGPRYLKAACRYRNIGPGVCLLCMATAWSRLARRCLAAAPHLAHKVRICDICMPGTTHTLLLGAAFLHTCNVDSNAFREKLICLCLMLCR